MTKSLKASAVSATLWSIVRVGWSSLASFLVFAFLIRRLDTADIGLFALASSFVEIVRVLAGAGLADGLQREPHLDDELLSSAFWGGSAISALLAIAMVIAAPFYAQAMHAEQLQPLIYALACLMVVSSFSNVHWSLILRGFGHKTVAIRTMIATVLGGAGAVVAVLLHAGVWALMVQAIASEAVGAVLAWMSSGWRPKFYFSWRRLKPLLVFGWGLVLTRLLWSVLGRIPDFFIGRSLGPGAVGVYRIAWRLVDLLGQMFLAPLSSVTYLVLARLQNDQQRFEAAYSRVVGLGTLMMAPLVVGFGVTAPEIVPLVFGAHASGSIIIAQILAVSAPVFVVNYFTTQALLARGKSYVVSQIAAVQLVSTLAISALAAPYGIVPLTIAYVLRGYLTFPYIQYMVQRHAQVGLRSVLDLVRTPIIALATMAATLLLISPLVASATSLPVLRLSILVPLGAATYFGTILLLERRLLRFYFDFARSLLDRRSAHAVLAPTDGASPSSGN